MNVFVVCEWLKNCTVLIPGIDKGTQVKETPVLLSGFKGSSGFTDSLHYREQGLHVEFFFIFYFFYNTSVTA